MSKSLYSFFSNILNHKITKFIFVLGIFVGVFIQFRIISSSSKNPLEIVQPWNLIIAFPFVLLSLFLHSEAWRKILRNFNSKLHIGENIAIYYISNLSRYLPGNYWYILSRSAMSLNKGIPMETSLSSTAIELILNLFIGMTLAFIGNFSQKNFSWEQMKWLILIFLISILLLLGVFLGRNKVNQNKKQDSTLAMKYINNLKKIKGFSKRKLIEICILLLFTWLSQGICFYLVLNAWGDIPFISNFPLVMFTYVTAWVIGFINPLTPNGLGTREAIFLIMLESKITSPIILSASLIMRLYGLIGEVVFAGLGWLFLKKEKN